MSSIQVYEYYDGYEHLWSELPEEQRDRVRYFVIGDVSERLVGICYLGELNYITSIGRNTHSLAWLNGTISEKEARKILRKSKLKDKNSVERYETYLDYVMSNREMLDEEHRLPEGHSASCSGGPYDISIRYDNNNVYSTQVIKEIELKIKLYELRERW